MITMSNPHHLFRQALDEFGDRVVAVPAGAWDRPTPCPEWTVRDLVHHVVEEELWAAAALAGETAAEIGDRFAGDLLGDDPVEAWQRAAAGVRPMLSDDAVLNVTVELPGGKVTATDFLYEMFADHLIHSWDLARAAGGAEALDSALVAACAEWFDTVEDSWRAEGAIGPPAPTPPGAGPTAALVARFGRDPR
ncbi:MAG: TIGR03086 family metal-binding protein [bacterium]